MLHFKRISFSVAVFALVLSPMLALAQTKERTRPTASSDFCTRIANVKNEINGKFSNLERTRTEKRTEITGELKERKEKRVDTVGDKRDEAQKKFDEAVAKVEKETLTAEQKAAIAAFKTIVRTAQATRKAAVDAAMQTFRSSVDAQVTKRQEAIRTAAAALKAAIAAAIAKAQADCAAGSDPALVKQALMSSMKAAQDQFRTDTNAVDKSGDQIRELAKVRNDSVRAANKTFKEIVRVAKETLKAALKKTTPAPAEDDSDNDNENEEND